MGRISSVDGDEKSGIQNGFTLTIPLNIYSELIKSKQTFLLVYTGIMAYALASWGTDFDWVKLGWVIVGLFFSVAGSTLLNMWWDRDIDAIMPRTKGRAIPSGRIAASTVLFHGMLFSVASLAGLFLLVSQITALVVAAGIFFDVVIYTFWLKRRSRFSILFGGIAGGAPAVAGWVAVTGELEPAAYLLGGFVVAWVPLHILSLALLPHNLTGYKEAAIPMWPVVKSEKETIRIIVLSAVSSVLVVILTGFNLGVHPAPLSVLLLPGFVIIRLSIKCWRSPSTELVFSLFKVASMLMVVSFLWLFAGLAITDAL